MRIVKTFLILAVAALNLAVMAGSVRSNKLVTDAEPGGGEFEASRNVSFAIGEAVGKFKAIVCLNTFHSDAATLEPGDGLFQEIGGGKWTVPRRRPGSAGGRSHRWRCTGRA